MLNKQFLLIEDGKLLKIIIADPTQLLSIEKNIKNNNHSYQFYITECDHLKIIIHKMIAKLFYTFSSEETNITQLIDHIINDGHHHCASDIHFEISRTECRLRFRIDGILSTVAIIPKQLHASIISRIKILSKLDIAEKRRPQDGYLSFTTYQQHIIECRISSCPTTFGEKIVIRLLNQGKHTLPIKELGMNPTCQEIFINALNQPQGLILITGPTGSGKTQTLYSALNILNSETCNIVTLEEPVEMQLNGINQIDVNKKIGLDFSNMLRFILRQDPDIIMIGEIRDCETAEIAFHAAETGHLVLATLHTRSTIETLERLKHLGIHQSSIAQSLQLIISQRLLRKFCTHCKNRNIENCFYCVNGYTGRIGIFELLKNNTLVRQLISEHAPIKTLTRHLSSTLYNEAEQQLKMGLTSQAEINRVLGEAKDFV